MTSTLAGMKMLFNPHPENAPLPIRGHCNSFSNVIDSSDLQLEKQSLLITATLAGMKMLFNPLPENAPLPNRGHCNSFSNLIDSSDSQ
jgi:hypothetical protein